MLDRNQLFVLVLKIGYRDISNYSNVLFWIIWLKKFVLWRITLKTQATLIREEVFSGTIRWQMSLLMFHFEQFQLFFFFCFFYNMSLYLLIFPLPKENMRVFGFFFVCVCFSVKHVCHGTLRRIRSSPISVATRCTAVLLWLYLTSVFTPNLVVESRFAW